MNNPAKPSVAFIFLAKIGRGNCWIVLLLFFILNYASNFLFRKESYKETLARTGAG